jgi:chemotaxis protein CheY-P-specific phosphatase CheC
MNATLDITLRNAAVATFEQVVFLLPDMPPDAVQRSRTVQAVATIEFSGPAAGQLQVHACEGLLPRLTANMMGQDAAPESLQLDALGEIANIICGQIFPHLEPLAGFRQQPPRVDAGATGGDAAKRPPNRPAASVQLGVESSRADVFLYLFGDAA